MKKTNLKKVSAYDIDTTFKPFWQEQKISAKKIKFIPFTTLNNAKCYKLNYRGNLYLILLKSKVFRAIQANSVSEAASKVGKQNVLRISPFLCLSKRVLESTDIVANDN